MRRRRKALSQEIRVPLPLAFSTLAANSYFRSELLNSLVQDALEAAGPQRTSFDVKAANLLEDPNQTVLVTPPAVLHSSIFAITFCMTRQQDADAAESKLLDALREPFVWKQATKVVKRFCLHRPCPQCKTTCVEPAQTSLLSPGLAFVL